MDVFAFREELVAEYAQFTRSFTRIGAEDIQQAVDGAYASGRYWPSPLIQLNPNFEPGGSIDELVNEGVLATECARIFRIGKSDGGSGQDLVLHRHQADAIDVARRGESYVLTTGTGSGKSLAYFIPIIDDVVRRKKAGDPRRGITAIVVYPMNALCNSQYEELEKFLRRGYGEGKEPVTFARYTGQVSMEDRDRIAQNPPDILLTNFVMLELIMTRLDPTDQAVRAHAAGLRYLVLDELHTYRGRQGADVAMLVRRVRERFNEDLLCIGTSATMTSEGSATDQGLAVADVATQLFGLQVSPGNVITETLKSVTAGQTPIDEPILRRAIEAGVPDGPTHEELSAHPVAAWVERKLGLDEQDGRLIRIRRPKTMLEASRLLSQDSGLTTEECGEYLAEFLLTAYQSKDAGGRNFFAFRLHQFISGAWNAYSTLEAPGARYVTLNGQQYKPGDRSRRLFALCFCRNCGQEYFPVWAKTADRQPISFDPRELADRSHEDEEILYGYLMPDESEVFNPEDVENHFPEEWLEFPAGEARLKAYYRRRYCPIEVRIDPDGVVSEDGLHSWFIPGAFRFCLIPDCDAYYDGSKRSDLSKLSGLSSEGRSSATTVLALSSLKHLIGTDLDEETKKLLAFTDNRQDASLQAGHFNDFIQILLLRGALLAAIESAPGGHLNDDVLALRVLDHLHLDPTDYAANPLAKGVSARNALKTLREVIGYRLYFDLQRGWRINNPNLEQLDLLEIQYRDLSECCQDEEEWRSGHPLLGSIRPEKREELVRALLDRMRSTLCIKSVYLDPSFQEQVRNRSFNQLKEPWGLSEEERPYYNAFMVPRPRQRGQWEDQHTVHVSYRSAFGRHFKSQAFWGGDNPHYPTRFDESVYNAVIDDVLRILTTYGYVEPSDLGRGRTGYRIDSSALGWHLARTDDRVDKSSTNEFFRTLYENVAMLLRGEDRFLHQLEAREHTAQVEPEIREEREKRFRKGLQGERVINGEVEKAGLPILFCSPTMELGVDIAALNSVYMRNVPPTPANYAQRSGRAGRSGQPALVVTYCAARSPHDQYFFSDPPRMVAGAVNPPTIDLANKDLVRSHLQAVWLAETGIKLGSSVRDVLDLEGPEDLPLRQDISEQVGRSWVSKEAARRGRRVLAMLHGDLSKQSAPWYTDTWLDGAANSASLRFNTSFDRWRSLFRATANQMERANQVLKSPAATEKDRKDAKARYDEAYTQQNLLLSGRPTMNSDFYTYRYLAAEGFLPGYNFPRLPLMAFIPGRKGKVARDSFLSRPRFLGLTEFGPQSIIYHEGSTYRVRRIILTIRDEATTSAKLPEQSARICPECGYGHFGDQKEFERCFSCDTRLEGGRRIWNLYRIEQVSSRRATRITSDEEERQRQGYDMITTLRFSEENGRPRLERAVVEGQGEELLELKYGPAATLWRINLGWSRRKEKTVYGFSVDPNTGEWTKDSQAPTDAEDDQVKDGKTVQRITPFVRDTRNVLVVRPFAEVSETAMVSFQYALKRGIEQEFQLEESELAAEPLPDRENRRTILFYEAAEGGAGVLTRLASDRGAVARIALRALEICHYVSESGSWTGLDDLKDQEPQCEAGCYRCLLSYYNQPDHPLIDRSNGEMLELLCRLTSGERKGFIGENGFLKASSSLEKAWLECLEQRGHNLPDRVQPFLKAYGTRPDFAYSSQQTLIYIDGPHHQGNRQKTLDAQITARLEDAGFTVVRFSQDQGLWHRIIDEYAWVFGPGHGADGHAE